MNEILLTLSYFDMFDYPLTLDELSQWLFGNKLVSQEELNKLIINKKIIHENNYYFLPGKSDIINTRIKRRKISLKKIKKARRIAGLLSFIPDLKMIAICSNLGYLNAPESADIDLFIVTGKNRIWTVRFWCALLMKILRQRPTATNIKNKICLSYFVTEDNLDLEHTRIADPDLHLIYLVSQYLPIYIEDNLWHKFIDNNRWINKYLPNFKYQSKSSFQIRSLFKLPRLPIPEKLYKKIQLRIMPNNLKQIMNNNTNKVIINNKMLKLHRNDKREEYNRKIKI